MKLNFVYFTFIVSTLINLCFAVKRAEEGKQSSRASPSSSSSSSSSSQAREIITHVASQHPPNRQHHNASPSRSTSSHSKSTGESSMRNERAQSSPLPISQNAQNSPSQSRSSHTSSSERFRNQFFAEGTTFRPERIQKNEEDHHSLTPSPSSSSSSQPSSPIHERVISHNTHPLSSSEARGWQRRLPSHHSSTSSATSSPDSFGARNPVISSRIASKIYNNQDYLKTIGQANVHSGTSLVLGGMYSIAGHTVAGAYAGTKTALGGLKKGLIDGCPMIKDGICRMAKGFKQKFNSATPENANKLAPTPKRKYGDFQTQTGEKYVKLVANSGKRVLDSHLSIKETAQNRRRIE